MDLTPWLFQIDSADAHVVAVDVERKIERLRCLGVEEHAVDLGGSLASCGEISQVGEKLIEMAGTHGPAAAVLLERFAVELRVDDKYSLRTAQRDVGSHARKKLQVRGCAGCLFPAHSLSLNVEVPLFTSKEVADESLEEGSHASLISDKVAKEELSGRLVWNQALVEQQANVEQKAIDAVVAVEVD